MPKYCYHFGNNNNMRAKIFQLAVSIIILIIFKFYY